jgi:hypothetical protein
VEGDARHHDRLAGRLAAPRQRDLEQARGLLGVVPEQLVEVAHAVEQQGARVVGLQAQVLRHHGGVLFEVGVDPGRCFFVGHRWLGVRRGGAQSRAGWRRSMPAAGRACCLGMG